MTSKVGVTTSTSVSGLTTNIIESTVLGKKDSFVKNSDFFLNWSLFNFIFIGRYSKFLKFIERASMGAETLKIK